MTLGLTVKRTACVLVVWMHHLSTKKPVAYGLGRKWEVELLGGERVQGSSQMGDSPGSYEETDDGRRMRGT